MPRQSASKRARILDAAIEEFAAHGMAGARIERIAKRSEANPRSIYVYFENKEGLFNDALDHVLGKLMEAVPLSVDDLPGYAGRLFDYLQAHPQAMRMSLWRHLERPAAGPADGDRYTHKIDKFSGDDLPVIDLIVLITGLASSWLLAPQDLLAADGRDPASPERVAEHRAVLVEAVRRICIPRA